MWLMKLYSYSWMTRSSWCHSSLISKCIFVIKLQVHFTRKSSDSHPNINSCPRQTLLRSLIKHFVGTSHDGEINNFWTVFSFLIERLALAAGWKVVQTWKCAKNKRQLGGGMVLSYSAACCTIFPTHAIVSVVTVRWITFFSSFWSQNTKFHFS